MEKMQKRMICRAMEKGTCRKEEDMHNNGEENRQKEGRYAEQWRRKQAKKNYVYAEKWRSDEAARRTTCKSRK
jgi:hypothetical protein